MPALERLEPFRAVPNKNCLKGAPLTYKPLSKQHLLFLLVMPIPAKIARFHLSSAGACFILTAGVPSLVTSADAHDWYPEECCHAMDCAPVESWAFAQKAQTGSLPQLSVTTKKGTAIVPQDLPRRESKDNRMHACIRAGPMGVKYVVCIFLPLAT